MESVLDTVTDAIADAGELVYDAALGEGGGGGRRLRRGLFVLMLLGAIIGIALWRRAQASPDDGAASDQP